MKKVKLCVSLFVLFMFFLLGTTAYAATVGQPLKAPEAGWKRYDNKDGGFNYIGTWVVVDNNDFSAFYNGGVIQSSIIGDSVTFKFYGTKIRIIAQPATSRSNKLEISMDTNIEYYSISSSTTTHQCLVYEKSNLTLGFHTVIIKNKATNSGAFLFDAIDIDDTGSLADYYQPTDLTATAGNAQVNLSWTEVTGATGYNVKRATTAGGPYTTIATSVTEAVYTDSTATNGTTYYYVVTTLNDSKESEPSNEVSATPQDQSPGGTGEASLVVTMANGSDQQYNLPMSNINSFINWYNSKATGVGQPYYCLNAKPLAPYTQRTDYLIFDKIVCFKVNQ